VWGLSAGGRATRARAASRRHAARGNAGALTAAPGIALTRARLGSGGRRDGEAGAGGGDTNQQLPQHATSALIRDWTHLRLSFEAYRPQLWRAGELRWQRDGAEDTAASASRVVKIP
jgi:hypothetical protein